VNYISWNGETLFHEDSINNVHKIWAVDLNAKEVYKILKKKGINYFYHANTVVTSNTFLENGALLSREFVTKSGLVQTSQKSDKKDAIFGINNFIFLDANDLGWYFRRPNYYGPVLFRLKLELLLSDEIPTVRITKENPIKWEETKGLNTMYHTDLNLFDESYLVGNRYFDGKNMFIITSVNGCLNFKEYLDKIYLDNPCYTKEDDGTPGIKNFAEFIKLKLDEHAAKFEIEVEILNRFIGDYKYMQKYEPGNFRKIFSFNQ
jgi:hypothetical protein